MAGKRKSPAFAATKGKSRKNDEQTVGDDSDSSGESPLRKKQNTSTSSAPRVSNVERKSSTPKGGRNNAAIAVGRDFHTPIECSPRDSDAEEENLVLHLAPPIENSLIKPVSVSTAIAPAPAPATITTKTEKLIETLGSIPTPQKSTDENLDKCENDLTFVDPKPDKTGNLLKILFWIGFLCFANITVFSVVTWSGMLLNERSLFQLELSSCKERLRQVHHVMGISDSEDNNGDIDNSGTNKRLQEQLFYWQELESQVQYWKKEAKRHQQYGEGIKEQCEEDLRRLVSEL